LLILKSNKPVVDRDVQNFEAHKGHSVGMQEGNLNKNGHKNFILCPAS
jgi:hypothetical protein